MSDRIFIFIVSMVTNAFCAEMVLHRGAGEFITGMERFSAVQDFSTVRQRTDRDIFLEEPLGYLVTKQTRDEAELKRLQKIVDLKGATGRQVRFDDHSGRYYCVCPKFTVMKISFPEELKDLESRAGADLRELLGAKASDFVFANTETDWVRTIDDPDPRILGQSYRFTRKINGGHVVDNTAYVRITYSGDAELASFEVSNPALTPVRVSRRVRPGATGERLSRLIAGKVSARNSLGEDVGVKSIAALKGIYSYLATDTGDRKVLIPHISFYCRYQMENGQSFEKFNHFSLDAELSENLDPSMIDDVK